MRRSAGKQKEMKITCSTNVLADFMLSLKSDCKFRRILAMDTKKNRKSHTHVNISRNKNAEVKSISKETRGTSVRTRSGELRVWFILYCTFLPITSIFTGVSY